MCFLGILVFISLETCSVIKKKGQQLDLNFGIYHSLGVKILFQPKHF